MAVPSSNLASEISPAPVLSSTRSPAPKRSDETRAARVSALTRQALKPAANAAPSSFLLPTVHYVMHYVTHYVVYHVTHCVTHYVSHYVMQYALSSFLPMKTSYAVAASVTYGCSLDHMQLQPRLHTLAAPIAYGCSLDHISRTAAASITYRVRLPPRSHIACSLCHLRLQPRTCR